MKAGRCACLGAAIGALGIAVSLLPAVLELEQSAGLAGLFALRGTVDPPSDVAVVSISGDSADALGVGSSDLDEWPRSLHAELVDRLAAAGASVIVLDIIFERASDSREDARLAQALAEAGRVVLLDRVRSTEVELGGAGAARVPLDQRILPIEPLREAALATAPFLLPTVPIRTSQFWTFGRSAAALPNLPAVALQVHLADGYAGFVARLCREDVDCRGLPRTGAALLAHEDPAAVMARIRRALEADASLARRLRRAGAAQGSVARLVDLYAGPDGRYVNYYGPAGAIPTVPMHEIVTDAEPPSELAGKAVFVGFAERRQSEQQDEFYTVFSQRTGQNLSGVEIGATAFANLLAGETLKLPGRPWELALVLAFGLALGAAARPRRPALAVAAAALLGAAYFGAAQQAFAAGELWLPLVVPLGLQWPVWLVAFLALEYRDVLGQRARIEAALGHYVPARVVRRLARESVDSGPAAELLEGVCLYTDAEHFTRVAESMTPAELARLMNDYYEVLCTAAERHSGLVTDISGDSMVAIWAAVRSDAELSHSACMAALAILDDVERFNREAGSRLPTRVGLDAGRLLLGDIGSPQRREYRAVGEIVTTAARLQGLNRALGTRVIVSDAVARQAGAFATRPLGRFLLLGKTAAIEAHELLGGIERPATQPPELFAPFAAALERFRRREFAAAGADFERIAAAAPGDGPTRFYIGCCERYAAEPPPPDWDGAVRMDVK